MRLRWVRNEPTRRDDASAAMAAGAIGLSVGIVVFYFARLLFAREPLRGTSIEPASAEASDEDT